MLEKKTEDYAWYLGACKAVRVSAKAADALPNCKKALELDPTAYPVYRELGLTYAAAGNPRKAAETLAQGVEISSTSYQAHYYLAKVLETRGDPARAAASYTRGLALAKNDKGLDAAYYRALIKAGLKRTALAKEKTRVKSAAKTSKQPRTPPPGNKQLAAACLEKFRGEFLKDNLGTALETSDGCLKFAPSDPALAAERAPLLVRLGRYEDGVKEYERAASLYGEKDPATALCRVKAAETWIKLGDSGKALAQYRLALKADPRDMNALKGLAAALEAGSDLSGAVEVYEKILKLEPGNEKALARKEELKTGTLTSAQILDELKLRRAVDEKTTAPQPEDINLFKALKAAETGGAVDYLKTKDRAAQGLVMERQVEGRTKLLLTGAGYKSYIFYATRDAVKSFEAKGIGLREIFQLRNLSGAPLFDKTGKLTPEGEEVWRGSAKAAGVKNWLTLYEPVPESPQAIQAAKEIKTLEGKGYREISEPEYLWLLRATDCPEDVMQSYPIGLRMIFNGARRFYMLCYIDSTPCMIENPAVAKLPGYIEAYRAGNTEISDAKTSTAFFGSGGIKKHRFCENGKIWGGDVPGFADPVRASGTLSKP
jgi:tetratricopeptide (TPR) repeat protein